MNASEKKTKILAKRILCVLWAVLIGSTVSSVYASPNWGGTTETSEVQQVVSKVEGTVIDRSGEPLIGVSVAVKGTTNGTVTDLDGKYTLNIASTNAAIITFTYVGYKPQSHPAKAVINVSMDVDSKVMDEVVVVGYGTQKKENLTGAVVSVDLEKTLGSRPIADVGRGLQGTVPGLSITIPSGEIGSDPTIKIRGQIASIQGQTKPLILLDNVEIPSIQMVNPDDIESISVLKDAASTSIYGAKAAFGVMLITTKKGTKTESLSIQYSNNFSWQNVAKKIDMGTIDAVEYSVLAAERIGQTATGAFWLTDRSAFERSQKWLKDYGGSVGPNDPMVYGRDWYVTGTSTKMGVRLYNPYDYMIKEWAPSQTHNLSINGKSGKVAYGIGLGYLDQSGMSKTAAKDDFKRYNASVKLTSELNKYITVRAGAIYSDRAKSYPYMTNSTTADAWYYLYRWGPLQPFGSEDGQSLRSPAAEAAQANTAKQSYKYTSVNLGATFNITKDWTVDADYNSANQSYDWLKPGTRFTARDTWSAPILKTDADGNQVYVNGAGQVVASTDPDGTKAYQLRSSTYTSVGANPDHIRRDSEAYKQGTANIYTTYNLKVGDKDQHALKFLLGMNRVESETTSSWGQKTTLFDITNPQFDLATGTQTSGGDFRWEAQLGYFGRINYAFMDKYLLEANIRRDGSSKFPGDLKWRWFPSFSAGWRVTEEAFMQSLNPIVSTLKLRGSWGLIGDQTVSNTLYVPTMTSINTTWLNGANKFPAYITPLAVDRNITWQDINTIDIGVDLRLFNDKLGVTYDWFQRITKNMIVPGVTLPNSFGGPVPQGNYGDLTTKGWELALDFNHRFSNGVGINITASLSDASSIITKYAEGASKSLSNTSGVYFEGKRFGDIYGYKTDRLYQKDDFEWGADGKLIEITVNGKKVNKLKGDKPVYQTFLQNTANFQFGPGDVKFVDANGDGEINNGKNVEGDSGDVGVIGNSTPRYEYGIRLGADYKGIDVSVFVQGIGQRKVWGYGPLALPGFNSADGAMPQTIAGDFWKEDRTDAFYPRPNNLAAPASVVSMNNMQVQDRYLLNMAYTRIKNITLGYTFPAYLMKKAFVSKARIYVALENFFTFDNLNGLPIDPETVSGTSMFNETNYNSGRTGIGAPVFKTASFGVQLNF